MNNHDRLIAGGVPPAILMGARFVKTSALCNKEKLSSLLNGSAVDASVFNLFDFESINALAERYPNLYNAMISDEGTDLILGLLSLKGLVKEDKNLGYGKQISPNHKQGHRPNRNRK